MVVPLDKLSARQKDVQLADRMAYQWVAHWGTVKVMLTVCPSGILKVCDLDTLLGDARACQMGQSSADRKACATDAQKENATGARSACLEKMLVPTSDMP